MYLLGESLDKEPHEAVDTLSLPGVLMSVDKSNRINILTELWNISSPLYADNLDILAGLTELLTTTAILFDIGDISYEERYCFATKEVALKELVAWHERGFGDQRPVGWIACRGISADSLKNSMDTYHGVDYAMDVYALSGDKGNGAPIVNNSSELIIAEKLNISTQEVKHKVAYLRMIGLLI